MEIQTSGKPIDTLLEKVLCMNILSSDYFKELYRLKTYHEVIDEIYNQVDHVEPWMTGNCRGPSTAFCLLYKFFTMKLTVKQMHGLLKHPDSPYIRAIGFLYLRYVADPKTLWGWCDPYIKDEEEFSPGSNGRTTTMGVYVRDLLLGQNTVPWKWLLLCSFKCKFSFILSLGSHMKLALKGEAILSTV
ncbi:pre-mRNA splicing factor SR-like 1 isoform X2 [Dendrobium catenatum]|uniref:pre-mRNA splicing factor SR-like 1 isoform X2 n=1 Tax=Dendrobium catenatum TaxID=906689 RepID=UPI0009F5E8B6|nr:pre-mRNA splicing factor SR-like 1 isoform X2 [Dendrobium catenatum]